MLGIIRGYDSNNTKVVLDENGLLQNLNTGDSIFRKVNINGMYSVDNTNNSTFELKKIDDNQNFLTNGWTKQLNVDSGKIYKINNKNRLIKSVDKITSYKLKTYATTTFNTNATQEVKINIDGRKQIDSKITVTSVVTDTTVNPNVTTITLNLTNADADIDNLTLNSNLYKSDGSFIGKVKIKDTNTIVLRDPIDTNQISVNAGDAIYVMNDIFKSTFISSNLVSKNNTSTQIIINLNGSDLINTLIYKKDNSFVGKVTQYQLDSTTNQHKITLDKIGSELSAGEELYFENVNSFKILSTPASNSTVLNIDSDGSKLVGKQIYLFGSELVGKVISFNSDTINNTYTITLDQLSETISVNDYVWDGQNIEIFNYKLTANKSVYIKNDTTNEYSIIGEITGNTSNTLTIGSITSNITINADTELFLSTNLLRINTDVDHQLNDKDDILIYNNFNDTILNNNKYKIYSSQNTSFNLIELSNITTTEIQAGGTTIYNVYGSEIGTCKVVTNSTTNEKTLQFDYINNVNPNGGIKINLNFGDELFVMNNNKLNSLNLIVIDDYSKGTKNNIKIGQITNTNNTVNNIKDGKILKINPADNLEKTADLTKTDNTIKFLSTNHNLSVGDMILIYGLENPSNNGTTITYYSKLNKTKAIVSQVTNDDEFVINYHNNQITETTINTKYYKIPLPEYNLKRVSTTGSGTNQKSVFELDTNHDLLDGDQLLIYNSNSDELNNLWIVKKEDDLKIRLIFSQTFNYNVEKIFSQSGTISISGIAVKVSTSSITGVNFNKYIKYSDIIRIENMDYNSTNSYLSKFPKVQYRSIKKIQDTIIELDEPIIIPYKKQNVDLIKYEIPNFTNDLQLNSLVRCKIGNVYETKKIIEIINDFTLKVDTAFSNDINYYVDLNQVVYQDTDIKSQEFNLDFKKIFTFNSKTFSGKEFFEKGSTTITYNNWEKFRYYVTPSDITNNITNYDIYNYCNKLIELNNLHWNYYQENYKILKIKAFTPNVNNYTKSIPELILFINKIIYNYNDKTYNSDLEIDTINSKNYNTQYYIDDKENESQLEKINNQLKIKTTKNINEYNSQQIKWNKNHQLKFTDFINQKFKLSDNYVKRFNKKNKITESEIVIDQFPDNNYQFNNIQGFSNGDKNIDIAERYNDSKYQIDS